MTLTTECTASSQPGDAELLETPVSLAAPRLSAAEAEAMAELKRLLEEVAWPHLYLEVGGGEPFAPDYERALTRVASLPRRDQSLLGLFALGAPMAEVELDSDVATVAAALVAAGLLTREHGILRTTSWVAAPVFGGQVMMGTPSTYGRQQQAGALAYLGSDSLLLAKLIGPVAGRRVLDLGAGCGAQGLLAVRGAREAVLTDIDPFSMRLSALNWALNDVGHSVLLGAGDLFEPVRGERFDLVVVLPPYVPSIEGSGISLTAAGGSDGLAFIRRLIGEVEGVLAPGGELVALAQLLCDDDEPLLVRELGRLAPGLESQLVLFDRHPLQPYIVQLSGRLAAHSEGVSQTALLEGLDRTLRQHGATGACTAAIRLRRPLSVDRPVGRRVVGAGGHLLGRDVLALSLGAGVAAGVLVRADGTSQLLDPVTAALLERLDGTESIAAAVEAAWGAPAGSRPEQLVEQAIFRLTGLLADGTLRRVRD